MLSTDANCQCTKEREGEKNCQEREAFQISLCSSGQHDDQQDASRDEKTNNGEICRDLWHIERECDCSPSQKHRAKEPIIVPHSTALNRNELTNTLEELLADTGDGVEIMN